MFKKKPYSGFSSVYDAVMRDVQYKHWSEFILSSYANHSRKILPKTVLDLGCGTCRLWEEFPKNVAFTGIDSSLEMLEIAKKKSNLRRMDSFGHTQFKFERTKIRPHPFHTRHTQLLKK